MALLKPTVCCEKFSDISLKMLEELNIKYILLDVDNTISSYVSKKPIDGSIKWIEMLKNSGYTVYIVSNNYKERVSIIAKDFSVPYISFAMKPLTKGFTKAKKLLSAKKSECLVVGDQIFTDILGANFAGMKSVLIEPIEMESSVGFKIKRKLEKSLRKKYEMYR